MPQNEPPVPKSEHNAVLVSELNTRITILDQDLKTLTELVLARFLTAEAETVRIAEIRSLLGAAHDLRRALDLHAHYIMVDHRGSRGSNDLKSAELHLFRALQEFAQELRELAVRYHGSPLLEAIRDRGIVEAAPSETPGHEAGHVS